MLQQSWRAKAKHAIPPALLNTFLLRFPSLYRTKLVYYETNLRNAGGIDELLAQMTTVLDVTGQFCRTRSSNERK